MTAASLELWLRPLDRARVLAYHALGRYARPLVRRRELRVALMGSALVTTSFVAAVLVPVWLLALGPIVWGTPHLLADVRYLVVRRGYHRRPAVWLAAGAPLAIAATGGGVRFGLLAAAAAMLVARAPSARRVVGLFGVGALAIAADRLGPARDVIFAHAHNFLAVALWWAWRRRAARTHLAVPLLLVLGSLAIVLGNLDRFGLEQGLVTLGPADMSFGALCFELVPGVRGPLALRLVLLFAFAQAVHYGVWTRLIPEEDRPRETPRSFRASYRALEADFGRIALWLAGACALAFAAWALWDVADARRAYLGFALFHGHLELAACALWWAEREAPAREVRT